MNAGTLNGTDCTRLAQRGRSLTAPTLYVALVLAMSMARTTFAGLADTPLPLFSDGTPSVLVAPVTGVAKRTNLQTEFLCTALDDAPVHIGIEVFDGSGVLQNAVSAGVGAVLGVGPGQTVTFGTSATLAYSETAIIPLPTGLQGSARIVASSGRVRCTVVLVDDAVTPPATLATLGTTVGPVPGALPASLPLPHFAGGSAATHALIFPGIIKRGDAETDVFCTSLAASPIAVGVEVIGPAGTIANSVAAGNGAIVGVAPGQTVTFGTTGTAAFFETQVIALGGVAQGAARVVSTSSELLCSAAVLDAAGAPPASLSGLEGAAPLSVAAAPRVLPAFSDGTPSRAVMVVPGVVARGRLETVITCTVVESQGVHVGVQLFDAAGTLLNDVGTGQGALLNVAPGRTVTFGTSTTATYLETALVPVGAVAQGLARIVASAPGVRCNVAVVDDAVTPPAAWATLAEGVQPWPVPAGVLPQFADGQYATHAAVFPGLVKRGDLETDVACTSLAARPINVGVEVLAPDGTVLNSISTGGGAVLNVQPMQTVTIGTSGTAALLETVAIPIGAVAQGAARVVSTSGDVTCNAVALDAVLAPPAAMTALNGSPLPHGVRGQLRYHGNGAPIAGATVQLLGTPAATLSSDATGVFAASALGNGNWTLTPAMVGGAGSAISALDASFALQSTVGLRVLTPAQRVAGDVTGNGTVTSLDASRILQRVVNPARVLPVVASCGRDWAFVPAAAAAPNQRVVQPVAAGCQAGAIAYEPLAGVAAGQDFLGVVYGDVTGNWTPPAGGAAGVRAAGAPRLGAARYGSWGRMRVPIYAGESSAALDLTLRFDAAAYRFVGVRRAGAAAGSMVAWHEPVSGVVRVAVASRAALDDERPSLIALFEPKRRGVPQPKLTIASTAEAMPPGLRTD